MGERDELSPWCVDQGGVHLVSGAHPGVKLLGASNAQEKFAFIRGLVGPSGVCVSSLGHSTEGGGSVT